MSLHNIKRMKSEKGFTIVELLIVIVVIGILAAIVIVAYNGVQNRAKTTSSQAASETVRKKAEAANSVASAYPTVVGDFAANAESSLAGSKVTLAAAAAGTSTIIYQKCTTAGVNEARVGYLDYTVSPNVTVYVTMGGTTCAAAAWGAAFVGGPF
jgi:prepilin-type N-terminal cleavage/methylation domain-containing protein